MELTQQNFAQNLLSIFEHLTNADFVAIDFEFSGIKVKPARTVMEQMSLGPVVPEGRPSTQERYEEIREVAEKYSVFQFGFTIGEQDKKNGGYILRPYNAYLNPLIVHRMDVDRDCTLSSSAVLFLQKNNFDINKLFSQGVPYLSREEHRRAILLDSERLDGLNVGDLDFDKLNPQATEFLAKTRQRIAAWQPKNKADFISIPSPRGHGQPFEMLYRRIVHQLVRKEFRQFLTTTSNNTMKVIIYDEPNEVRHKRSKLEAFFSRLSKQIGLRWVIEAMVGGDLSDLSVSDIYLTEGTTWVDVDAAQKRFSVLAEKLRARRPALIGHNPFTDLVYLYRTFIGPLPETVTEFSRHIHHMFPIIIDTKYLATHHGNMEASSLVQLSDEYKKQTFPLTRESPMTCVLPVAPFLQQHQHQHQYLKYDKRGRGRRGSSIKSKRTGTDQGTKAVADRKYHHDYESRQANHEAGFDSYLTAKLAIKSSAKLAVSCQWAQKLKQPETQRKRFRDSVVRNLPEEVAQLLGVTEATEATEPKTKKKKKERDDDEEALIEFSSSESDSNGSDHDDEADGEIDGDEGHSAKKDGVVAAGVSNNVPPLRIPTAPAAMLSDRINPITKGPSPHPFSTNINGHALSPKNILTNTNSVPQTNPSHRSFVPPDSQHHASPPNRIPVHAQRQQPQPQQRPSLRQKAFNPNAVFTPTDLAWSRATATQVVSDLYTVLPHPVDPQGSDPKRWQTVPGTGLPRWMPDWRSDFWLVFGNKLRVNGTIEGVVDLLGGD